MSLSSTHITRWLNATSAKAAAVGAAGAVVGNIVSSLFVGPFFDFGLQSRPDFGTLLLGQALMAMFNGAVLSAAILAYDNQAGLRGRWDRDLWRGLPLFAALAFLSGGLGQLFYSFFGLSRGLPWVLMGGGIGASIGLLRRDKVQAQRGALGGALGGLIGGLMVDAALAVSYTDDTFATFSQIGMIITAALIALLMRVVQDALKAAWLLGISTGPYEGKEYALTTQRVTIGRSQQNDISLFREEYLPDNVGALVFQNDAWHWQGAPVVINGVATTQAVLQPGDTLQLGEMRFRFQSRSLKTPFTTGQVPLPPPAPELPPRSFPATPPMQWFLQNIQTASVISPPQGAARLSIGRAAGNDIVLNDEAISSRHAVLEMQLSTLLLTDLGSTNGTKVNGQNLSAHRPTALKNGDVVTFGRSSFTLRSSH